MPKASYTSLLATTLSIIFFLAFSATVAQAETVSIVTYYGKTGGIFGDGKLNIVGNKINGRDVCPTANTNANATPGCDMSSDSGYQKNDPNDPTDDTYTGDLIVRTSDLFELYAGWAVNGTSDPITLSSTLPANKGLAWDALPSSCKAGSSISADGLTMTCVRIGYDKNGIGSYSEDLPFNIKALPSTPNGVVPGELSITITGPSVTNSDTTEGNSIIITAAPKWNLQKATYNYTKNYEMGGVKGYIVRYLYYLEADEVIYEIDSASAVLGNESLGENFTLEFDDILQYYEVINNSRTTTTKDLPNAELIGCGLSYSHNSDPYPVYNTANPDRSVASPATDMNITCTQAGGKGSPIHIKHTGIDASLKHVPTKTRTGNITPLTRSTIAIGNIEIFVPYADILAYGNSTPSNDSGTLYTKNTVTSFDPVSISGQSNFGAETESTNDNAVDANLYYCGPQCVGGNFYKWYIKNINSVTPIETASGWYSGDGVLTPGRKFGARVQLSNSGGKAFADSILCDVIDTNTQDMIDIVGQEGQHAAKPYWNTASYNYVFEYATGYVGAWPPPIDNNNAAAVITECSDPNITWHATTGAARAVAPISKIRLRLLNGEGPIGGQTVGMLINLQARSDDQSGQMLPNGTNIVNYTAVYDTIYNKSRPDNWYGAYRKLHSYPTLPESGDYKADRAVLTRAIVRTQEDLSLSVVEPGDVVAASIHSTFTADASGGETNTVKVIEFLDAGLKYVIGSGNIGDPSFGSCSDLEDGTLKTSCTADDQILIWDLGMRTANQPLDDITFEISVGATAESGTIHTYTFISSPSDSSLLSTRTANRNMTVVVPSALLISKEVNTPFRTIDQSPIEFTTFIRNGASKNLTNLDVIDVLPFNGDGTFGVDFTVSTTTISHKRFQATAFTGSYEFLSAEGGYSCTTGDNWFYSNTDPRQINLAPTANSNKAGGSTTWCQGTKTGPAGGCGFNNADVTAIRLTGPALAGDASCSMNVKLKPTGNKKGDVYTNNSGAYANGVSLPVMSNDVSAFIPATLFGDTVWIDANANGIQDEGEVGVEGITLELLDENNAVLATTTTDKDGKYQFIDLTADKIYKVKATIESFYAFSPKAQGSDITKDSNIDPTTSTSDNIILNFNQQNKTIDIGVTSSLTVNGKVYKDDNINGTFDNETTIPTATINLYKDVNNDNKLDADDILVSSIESDASGDYSFTNVFSGEYVIEVDTSSNIPATHIFNGQNLAVTIVDTSISNQNFPFIPLVRAYQPQGTCGVAGFSETFGTGIGRVPFPASVTTTYTYNDGTSAIATENYVQDGQYAILDKSTISSAGTWWIIDDDATGDLNGRMLMLNTAHNTGEYYRQSVSGLTIGKTYSFVTYIANPYNNGNQQDPNVKLSVIAGATELASVTTGPIPEDVGVDAINWKPYTLVFTATSSTIDLVLKDEAPNSGSMSGNDLVIDGILLAETCKDYGDAPITGTSYGEAVHAIKEGLHLGSVAPDAESANQSSADASGDDSNGDDEDGVTDFPKLTDLDAGISYEVDIKVTNILVDDANVIAWIDIDANGVFDADEASEITLVPAGTNNGTVKLKWLNIPADIAIADSFARVRLSSETITANDAATYVLNGEVEDYPFTIEVGGFPVKGRVFKDINVDGNNDGTEEGISALPIVLVDLTNNTCISTKTDAEGNYSFFPVIPGNYQLYEASRETVPTPQNCNISGAKDPSGYRSTTANILASFAVLDAEVTGKDFGDVNLPIFTPNNSSTVLAGNVVFYAHRFTPQSSGSVNFVTTNSTPVTSGWSSILYHDEDCNGKLDGTEANSPLTASLATSANENICLINKVYAPSNVANGETYSNVITANFNFNNAIAGTHTLQVTDLSKAVANTSANSGGGSSKLELRKTVQNMTQAGAIETETQNQARPGDILKYRIYYSNTGTGIITDLKVKDAVPEFTVLDVNSLSCETTPINLTCTPPNAANDPDLNWEFTGVLKGGADGFVSYQVTIE